MFLWTGDNSSVFYLQLKTILQGHSILITGRSDSTACCQPGRACHSSSSSYPGRC